MLVAGLAPVGCLPIQKNNIEHACVAVQNADAIVYNSKLQKLLVDVQTRLSGSKLAYFDAYNPILDMINDPTKYGKIIQLKASNTYTHDFYTLYIKVRA